MMSSFVSLLDRDDVCRHRVGDRRCDCDGAYFGNNSLFRIGGILMVTRVQRWGNSPGLRIPKAVLAEAHIDVDDKVQISVEGGRIIIEPVCRIRGKYTIEELVALLPENYEAEELDWDEAVGGEV
jgi:antitoxin MazE